MVVWKRVAIIMGPWNASGMSADLGRPSEQPFDPRMRGFRARASVEDVHALIDERVKALGSEEVGLIEAAGRVLASDVVAGNDVPGFDRAAMDGYAVRGEETFGASAYSPAVFTLVGSARPGRPCETRLGPGEAIEITTGSPVPDGADAVVKVEATERVGRSVSVVEPTPPGRHVGSRGEDIAAGTVVLRAGRVLRPQDLGVLSAVGCGRANVVKRPRVTVVVTGDELLAPGTPARGCRIADIELGDARRADRSRRRARRHGRPGAQTSGDSSATQSPRPRCDPTWCSSREEARPDRRTMRRGSSRSLANWPCMAWHCGRRARRASDSSRAYPSCSCRATRSVASAPTTSSAVESSDGSEARPSAWPYRRAERPLARKLVLGRWPGRLRAGADRRGAGRAAGDQRGLDPVEHHAGRRLRRRAQPTWKATPRGPRSRSGCMTRERLARRDFPHPRVDHPILLKTLDLSLVNRGARAGAVSGCGGSRHGRAAVA